MALLTYASVLTHCHRANLMRTLAYSGTSAHAANERGKDFLRIGVAQSIQHVLRKAIFCSPNIEH